MISGEDLQIDTKGIHEFAHVGDNLTLPCTILGGDYNPFLNPVIWYKLVPGRQKPVQINTGRNVQSLLEYTLPHLGSHAMISLIVANLGITVCCG